MGYTVLGSYVFVIGIPKSCSWWLSKNAGLDYVALLRMVNAEHELRLYSISENGGARVLHISVVLSSG